MSTKKQTVIINGKTYDMASGQPLSAPNKNPVKTRVISDIAPNNQGILAKKAKPAPAVKVERAARTIAPHTRANPQKSTTLRRDILKKPVSKVRPDAGKIHRRVQKSERITKFAPHTSATQAAPKIDKDLAAQTKALEKAHAEHIAKVEHKSAHISSRVIKEHLLGQAIDKVPVDAEVHPTSEQSARKSRFASVAMTSVALLFLGGYLTFINIPNLSVRIAAASTGIDASLPSYQPAGYRIHGPISYQDGEVNVNYKSNNSSQGYKITQRPTDWDPIATLDNYVESDSKNDYQIHSVQGLTVYTYNKKAVWVNGGILHIIAGNAPLSNQQVEHIVASM